MNVVQFENKEERDLFDTQINTDPMSFIQQSTNWADIVCPISGDKPVYCYIKSDKYFIGASLYLFENELGNILVSNIQAGSLGCFSYQGESADIENAYTELVKKIKDFAREKECVTLTVTSNPYTADHNLIKETLLPDTGMDSFISIINIKEYFDADGNVLFRDYNRRSNLSRNIKKSYSHGFEFRASKSMDQLSVWYKDIHCRRIKELGGTPISSELFENMASNKQFSDNFVFFEVYKDDKLVAGDVCIYGENGNLDNFMMSTDSDFVRDGLNFFLVDNILKWCFQNNISIYNWQSSNPPNGGIFRFKEQWGSQVLPYSYFTCIMDQAKFDALIKNDIKDIMTAYAGHFVAPYKSLTNGELGFFNKQELNETVNIYQN